MYQMEVESQGRWWINVRIYSTLMVLERVDSRGNGQGCTRDREQYWSSMLSLLLTIVGSGRASIVYSARLHRAVT